MADGIQMKMLLMIAFATVAATGAGSIITSKDSLWIYNNSRSGRWTDTVTMINNGPQGVRLDSIRLHIDEWDTPAYKSSVIEAEARMVELHGDVIKMRYCTIDSVGEAEYRMDFSAGSSTGDTLFAIGPSGDSTVLCNLQIGYCFTCGLEKYPLYLAGSLHFYFSNRQVVSIHIYSDDNRPTKIKNALPVRPLVTTGSNNSWYLINGKLVTGKTESYLREHKVHRLIPGM